LNFNGLMIMKRIKYIIVSICLMGFISCNESSWLKEDPLDFYAPENSYETPTQFRQSLSYLYDVLRSFQWTLGGMTGGSGEGLLALALGDIAYGGTDYPDGKYNNFKAYFTPTTASTDFFWQVAYNSITNTNTILNRLELNEKISDDDRKAIKGEALFFRGYWYNFLANLYGGVPLILEESSTPRRDYVRATRDATYDQARKDLEEAGALLLDINNVTDGMISKQAVQHLLTEVYLSLGKYQEAVNTASAVIDHPEMGLMTTRFGSRANDPGDPYWDLFQVNNQNRTSGNKEGILVLQYEYQNSGSTYGNFYPRYVLPQYFNAKVESKDGGTVLAFTGFTAEKGGRGIGVIHPTDFFFNEVWGDDFDNDLRNSSNMIVRDFKIDNPEAKGYGEWMVKDGWLQEGDKQRNWYPFVMKFSRRGGFPDELYAKNSDGSIKLTPFGEHHLVYTSWTGSPASISYKDEYLFRLAGTYLLRAEAHLKNNQPDKAADDINKLRDRAQASRVTASDVDIDLILDEQMRELYFEDFRVVTLFRLGKVVERARKYNPRGVNVGDNQNLLPIPYSEIERNIFATIEQNPDY